MSNGRMSYVDPELEDAIEKIGEFGDFSTKREASQKAGEILNTALDEFGKSMMDEMGSSFVDERERREKKQRKQSDSSFGIDYDLLGL